MKKNILFVLAASAILTLSSCGGGQPASSSSSSIEASTSQKEESTSKQEESTSEKSESKSEESSSKGGETSSEAESSEEEGNVYKDELVTEESIVIHYYRIEEDYDDSSLWVWYPGGDGAQYFFDYTKEVSLKGRFYNEVVAIVPISAIDKHTDFSDTYGIIIRSKTGWSWQTKDMMVNLSDYQTVNGVIKHVYFIQGDETAHASGVYEIPDAITNCYFRNEKRVTVNSSNEIDEVYLYENGVKVNEKKLTKGAKTVLIDLPKVDNVQSTVNFDNTYKVEAHFVRNDVTLESEVEFYGVYGSDYFNNLYAYDGELGALYTEGATTFRVWSPFAKSITLYIYSNGTPTSVDPDLGSDARVEIDMVKGEKGVWEYTFSGDLDGLYYTYNVVSKQYPNGKEIVDPYAKSCGINGLRGMILDFSQTNPDGWDEVTPNDYDRKELAVYETHLVDPTMSETWTDNPQYRKLEGTFKGFIQEGTTYSKDGETVPTGYDHIYSLGPNAIQLQPIFDQANDEVNKSFNWGYNPLNYNCLEGSYSSDPYNGAVRVREFKELVAKLNDDGMNVIMDVVYNHVNSVVGENFDVLMPHYYFRYDGANNLSNGSGCGNETTSENYMFAKFMTDSALFWAKEYKLGGFRFDLMALHNREVMDDLTAKVKAATFDNFCIYGEPWTGGGSPLAEVDRASQVNLDEFKGYGAFNDLMRDALIKSGMNPVESKGWGSVEGKLNAAPTDVEAIIAGIKGQTGKSATDIITSDPNKAVNYASCHDNYTLQDRIAMAYSTDKGVTTKASADLLHYGPMLNNALVFASNGTSFMLSGEEFLRSKTREDGTKDGNSYNASYKENALDYNLAIENADVVAFYERMISLKKFSIGFGLEEKYASKIEVHTSANGKVIYYDIVSDLYGDFYRFAFRNGSDLADGESAEVDFTGFDFYYDSLEGDEGPLSEKILGKETLRPFEVLIAEKAIDN
ncbi:MAG: hypothetical protein II467_03665 [Bacilli bacterium]|nr:hypothetical protein [Bacilli bacterium]